MDRKSRAGRSPEEKWAMNLDVAVTMGANRLGLTLNSPSIRSGSEDKPFDLQ
ncbi:MAG TPA: hypothetical protein VGU63_08650 [Candidatus Acidoferrales bacterium]|nr:hypothetical protein [Candidatus Acidoferrales bacterium]